MGQGLNTKLIQVASRELSIDANKIHVGDTSTEVVANAVPTGGSTGSDLYGHAVIDACRIVMNRFNFYLVMLCGFVIYVSFVYKVSLGAMALLLGKSLYDPLSQMT